MGAVQAREGLHGGDARQSLVHVHAAEKRLVKARLELVGHQEDLILIRIERLAYIPPLRLGFSDLLVSVNGSGPDSESVISPEKATNVANL